MSDRRAFICSVQGLSEGGVYMAESPSKARAQAYRASRELGYHVGFPDIIVRRAARFDGIPHPGYGGFTMDFAEHLLLAVALVGLDEPPSWGLNRADRAIDVLADPKLRGAILDAMGLEVGAVPGNGRAWPTTRPNEDAFVVTPSEPSDG